jgi:F-type H+-transporting ATPase subunit delta
LSEHHLHAESFVGALVTGDQATLARRYADALYALAAQVDAVDAVAADLRGLRRIWAESAEWRFIATDPRLGHAELAAAVAQVATLCDLGDLSSKFLSVVAQNRRLDNLPGIIKTFLEQVAAKRGEFRAEVRSATPLNAAQSAALAASLNAIAGGKVHLAVTEDASLIGGLTVKIGPKFIDASVKTRLDTLERSLIAGAVA